MKQQKKILLVAINSKYIHSNPAIYSLRAYQQAYAPEYTPMVSLASYTINHRQEEILADIYGKKPDVLAFSCYIWNIMIVRQLVRELKKVMGHVKIWLGGPEVSYDGEALMGEMPEIDGVMIGEGEQTFAQLCACYAEEKELSGVAGILYRKKDGTLIKTGVRPSVELTSIPFLYSDLDDFSNRIIYYESSRGCPFRCSYCLSSIDKTVRLRELSVVLKELQFFLDNRVAQVKFVDRTFNCNKKHALAIWKYLLEHDNGTTNFHFEVAADLLDGEELAVLNAFRPGAVQLEIGVQTTNPDSIREIERTTDIKKLKETVAKIRAGNNIHLHLDLIAGLPYEDMASFARSFNDVYAMKPEQLQLGFLKVLKGSKMYRDAEKYGIVYTSMPPYEVLYTNWISYDDVLMLKKVEEMVELYYNSNQYTYTLPMLLKEFASPYEMFRKLALFYEANGYFTETPARSYRYHVLLSFIREAAPDKEVLFKELLTMDIYLRENAKSRPEFAPPADSYKTEISEFYRREMQERTYLTDYQDYDARQMARMTHIEVFQYNLHSGVMGEEPLAILYDYRRRNPLTHEAKIYEIKLCSR